MCWSAEVSLITFISSSLLCSYLWWRNGTNDRAIAIWVFWFSLMQLFEFFMWRNMKNHTWASKLSYIFILMQPVVLAIALLVYRESLQYNWVKWILYGLICLGIMKVISGSYFAYVTQAGKKWLSVRGEHCHLIWPFLGMKEMPYLAKFNWTWYLALALSIMCITPTSLGAIYLVFGIVTYNVTKAYYGNEVGSLWCWICNALALMAIILHPLIVV